MSERYPIQLLQAISDWQQGGDARHKARCGRILKEFARSLPAKFREAHLSCFRRIALDNVSLSRLGGDLVLSESISSWTFDSAVAKEIKRGVPPPSRIALIFSHTPAANEVVLNLRQVYADPEFQDSCRTNLGEVHAFDQGIGRYANSQSEVILDVKSLLISDVYAAGGYSGNREELARSIFGRDPSEGELKEFDSLLERRGRKLGAGWIQGDAARRVAGKLVRLVEQQRARDRQRR